MKLFGVPLSTRLYFTLWVGLGSLVGLLGGVVIATGSVGFLPVWLGLVAAFVGGVWWLARRDVPAPAARPSASVPIARAAPRAAPAPVPRGALHVDVDLPEIPAGFPPVVGVGEETTVRLRVSVQGQMAEGAAVRLVGTIRDGARSFAHEGVTGSGGTVAFTIHAASTGELMLDAEVSLGESRGRASTTVGVVRYAEEIERLFGEFRAYATGVLGPDSATDTARELAERLRRHADVDAGKALLELARIYELVAYGERPADRRLYLSLVGALLTLEGAPMPESTPSRAARALEG